MAILLSGVSVPLDANDEALRSAATKKLGVSDAEIDVLRAVRQALDARKHDIRLVYTLHVTLADTKRQKALEQKFGSAHEYTPRALTPGSQDAGCVVVVGAGPCGLFAALTLAQHGYRPLLIERGKSMDERTSDVKRLADEGILNEESNICFGAGGAGAFSDGKLTTRIKDGRTQTVLDVLASCGAPDEIRYLAKPHTGTEHIRTAVQGIIARIQALGGEVSCSSKLTSIRVQQNALTGITYHKNGLPHSVDTRAVILAVGHSARDTIAMLLGSGVCMQPKPFAVGLRIEHRQEMIDRVQYGDAYAHPRLGAAEYRLTSRHGGRGVYTFCMCPGGEVVCSATEPGGMAVNGMSYYARSGDNSNSAVVVGVNPGDFGAGALAGIDFQREMERAAYRLSGGYGAPVQTWGDFAAGRATQRLGQIIPSYRPYTHMSDLHTCLPDFVAAGIASGVADFGRRLSGFDMPEAVLTGVETRTSSPVRMPREIDFQSQRIHGLYPAGEGAGYAGGIVSAAVDGIRCAETLIETYARPI